MSDFSLTGGCFCGGVRYRMTAPALYTNHCHCSICRRLHGALFVTFSQFPREHFSLEGGEAQLSHFDSSAGSRRSFCARCGCNVFSEVSDEPDVVYLAAGTLDDGAHPGHPEAEEEHIFYASKVPWFDVCDPLPKLEEE